MNMLYPASDTTVAMCSMHSHSNKIATIFPQTYTFKHASYAYLLSSDIWRQSSEIQ